MKRMEKPKQGQSFMIHGNKITPLWPLHCFCSLWKNIKSLHCCGYNILGMTTELYMKTEMMTIGNNLRDFLQLAYFFGKSLKTSNQAFGKNLSTPSWFYKFFKNTCRKSAFILIFLPAWWEKIVIYKEKHHGKCNIILYTLPELFCYVNRDMYINKEWDATVSNNTCIKSTFTILY